MRCPHCAARDASGPTCWSCGLQLAAPVVTETLDGFEPTHNVVPPVEIELLADFLPTEAQVPDLPLAKQMENSEAPLPRCAQCGVSGEPGALLCVACGARFEAGGS